MNEPWSKHLIEFRNSKLEPGERVIGFLEGWVGDLLSGKSDVINGTFILTNIRACFYRKGFFGEYFENFQLSKITSVTSRSIMGFRMLSLQADAEILFKTQAPKELFDQVVAELEKLRIATHTPATSPKEIRDEIECPYCAEPILRKAKVCKHCGRVPIKSNPDPTKVARTSPVDGVPSELMMIRLACGCGANLKAKPHLAGKNVRCPQCNSPVHVPSGSSM